MIKKFRELTWSQICSLKLYDAPVKIVDRDADKYSFVFGFCAFVNANWTDKKRTFKYAFKYFSNEYLDMLVEVEEEAK